MSKRIRTYQCSHCGHTNETKKIKKDKKNQNIVVPSLIKFENEIRDLPICVEVKHCGFWITNEIGLHMHTWDENCNKNSVMLTNDCLLYIYKIALRHLLLSIQAITPKDVDSANLVPHIKIRNNPTDPFSKYKMIQGKKYIISSDMVSVKNDFITIEIDKKNDLHCTLIYSKKIKERIDLLEAFKTVIKTLNQHPGLIKQYIELPYFGEECINYWYDCPNGYPFNIPLDPKYVSKNDEPDFNKIKTTIGGSIIYDQ